MSEYFKYNILSLIGKGSYGKVYKIKDQNEKICILKQIDIIDHSIEELKKESDLLSSLDSPYIVKHFQTIVSEDSIKIIMEYCDDGDLSQFIKLNKDPIDENIILRIFEQISYGLKYLHTQNIIHRDIKPANIFLFKDGRAKIGDFGVGRLINTLSLANTFVGTPYYLSPELCYDKPYNEKSDIWSLGCVVYEMLSLKKAFEANNPASLLMKIIKDKPDNININKYSKKLIDLVFKMLDKNISSRPDINYVITELKIIKESKINKLNSNNDLTPRKEKINTNRTSSYNKYDLNIIPKRVRLNPKNSNINNLSRKAQLVGMQFRNNHNLLKDLNFSSIKIIENDLSNDNLSATEFMKLNLGNNYDKIFNPEKSIETNLEIQNDEINVMKYKAIELIGQDSFNTIYNQYKELENVTKNIFRKII